MDDERTFNSMEALVASRLSCIPNINKGIRFLLKKREQRKQYLPEWCFLPTLYWAYLLRTTTTREPVFDGKTPLTRVEQDRIVEISTLATWRYTKGVYSFDPNLVAALTASELSGKLPIEAITRLPEWAIYIATPGVSAAGIANEGDVLAGMWVSLAYDHNNAFALNICPLVYSKKDLLDVEPSALLELPIRIKLSSATVGEITDAHMPADTTDAERKIRRKFLSDILSLILYINSEEPDLKDSVDSGPTPKPTNPKITQSIGKKILKPAKKMKLWIVGDTIGHELRATNNEAIRRAKDSERTVKSHIRRGHWHGFWTGPRQGERSFKYQWLPPTLVRGADPDK